ncbi:MAG: hypothetical protein DRJ56_00590 [Thermoprotei archaeon]|nr:MAG: hypothetical protein DRJ56_00590 [Thermoprotei archaeon]
MASNASGTSWSSLHLLKFSSPDELLSYMNDKVRELEAALEAARAELGRVRTEAERLMEVERVLSEVLGVKPSEIREIDVRGVRVVMDAKATDEVAVYEEVVASLQETLDVLKRVRDEVVTPLVSRLRGLKGVRFVVEVAGVIPTKILIKFEGQ